MRRSHIAITAATAVALAIPASAPASISEIGIIGATRPATVPSCPESPCEAVAQTTGFQVKVGSVHNPLSVTRSGTIVAWSVSLGKPTIPQIRYFNAHEGGTSEAGIAVLRPQPRPNLTYKLVGASPMVKLQSYFGETAQFPLETTLQVKKGDVIALTVPTWAPTLALGFGKDTSWRASRGSTECKHPSAQAIHTQIGSSVQYYCLYQEARLTYSATLISTP